MAAAELINTTLYNDANLVAYYQLEANGNATLVGTNLSATGSPAFNTGKFGNAVDFGSSQTNGKYLLQTSSNNGIDGGNITIMCWFNLTTNPNDANQHSMGSQGSATSFVSYFMNILYNGGTPLVRFVRAKHNVGDENSDYTFTPTTGTWYLAAITYDGTNIRGYINGVLVAGPTSASGSGSGNCPNGVSIGDRVFSSSVLGASFPGLVDDFAIFSRVLSTQEILDHYNGDDIVTTTSTTTTTTTTTTSSSTTTTTTTSTSSSTTTTSSSTTTTTSSSTTTTTSTTTTSSSTTSTTTTSTSSSTTTTITTTSSSTTSTTSTSSSTSITTTSSSTTSTTSTSSSTSTTTTVTTTSSSTSSSTTTTLTTSTSTTTTSSSTTTTSSSTTTTTTTSTTTSTTTTTTTTISTSTTVTAFSGLTRTKRTEFIIDTKEH